MSHFPLEENLTIHDLYCSNNEAIRIMMLEVNKEGIILYIKFKNYDRFIRVLFIIHADFESFRLTHAS